MNSITLNELRIGNFTSSEIVALTTNGKATGTFGAPFYTYVEECNMERRLGRSIESEENARNLSWGKLCEKYVGDNPEILGLEYSMNLSETKRHPEIEFWSGSDDATKEDTVCDIKSPRTLKSFCQLVDGLYVKGFTGIDAMNYIRKNHKSGDKYFYQLVSNACIHNKQFAELIVFLPYQSELPKLREVAQNWDAEDQWKYSWIYSANDTELPYLIDGGFYKNKTVIRFEVPQADKDFLKSRVLEAGKLLTQPQTA